jgi:phage shock protein C
MSAQYKRLYRSRNDRIIGGVCSGLGEYLGIDPTVVRLVFIVGLFLGFGSLGLIYLVLLVVVPEEPDASEPDIQVVADEATTLTGSDPSDQPE